ncbi:hypothetical protein [Priestia flexa]|uniref:hypothetical protein n=2 Tax=Priestia flexa TaxID=86664 RepID=UPI001C948E75|nr:hypothetical protein [Priestia flexa]MBY6085290.1 hypothetical protein [Priestia flexa]
MMLVEINLLPQKERGNKPFVWGLVTIAGLVLLVGSFIIWEYFSLVEKEQSATIAIQEVQADQAVKKAQLQKSNDGKEVEELVSAIEWAQSYPMKTVPIIKELTAALPDRGFLKRFAYSAENETVEIQIQFDEQRQSSYYLSRLKNDVSIVKDAQVLTVEAEKSEKENEDKTIQSEESIIPRYVATYSVQIDRKAVGNLVKKEKEKEDQ